MSPQAASSVRVVATAALISIVGAGACSDATAPLPLAASYELQLVQSAPLPFVYPGASVPPYGPRMLEQGRIEFLNASLAQRSERATVKIEVAPGDSTVLELEWTSVGPFRREGTLVIVHYPLWTSPSDGPLWPEDTLVYSASGLTHTTTGGLGTLTRFYAPAP